MPENFTTFLSTHAWIFILAAIWTIPWKGVALWRAARNRSTPWFVVLLIINTLGVLEIIYIFAFSKKIEAEAETGVSQSVEEQKTPKPEKIVLDIKREGEKKEEQKKEVKPELDDLAPKS
jgi:methionyl-tRNA synthetase